MELAVIPSPDFNAIAVGPVTVRLYALCLTIGGAAAVYVGYRKYLSRGDRRAHLIKRGALLIAAAGVLGARFAFVSTNWSDFASRPWAIFFLWEGGLAIFGGIVLGAVVAAWYVRRHRGRYADAADAAALALPIGQAIGRWGNYFNQELYGRPLDRRWAVAIDPGHRVPGYEGYDTFHPTFLYESLWNVGLLALLVWLDRNGRVPRGALFGVYLIGYGIGRFLTELLRIDTTFRLAGLSRNAWVALGAIVVGVVVVFVRRTAAPAPEFG